MYTSIIICANNQRNAYCEHYSRWLRARKFDLNETIKMLEEATECSAEARKNEFYPSPSKALGCDTSYYIKQYPQVYYGHGRNGCPVFYSKPALIDINAIRNITSLPNIINFHWNAMMHEFVHKLKDQYVSSNGQSKRYACICVLDLKHLSAAQLSKRPLKLIKEQSFIDSLCFPETLSHMAIVNAPTFFTLTWKIIKSWIDERTANKVSVIGSNKQKLVNHLTKYIDQDNLLVEYGGNGPSMDDKLKKDMIDRYKVCGPPNMSSGLQVTSKDTYLMPLSSRLESKLIAVKEGGIVKLTVFTRSLGGGYLNIRNEHGSRLPQVPESGIRIKHKSVADDDETELPTKYELEETNGIVLSGPGSFKVELRSAGERKGAYVLLATTEYEKEHIMKNRFEGKSQVGDEIILISSQSMLTGTF